MGSTTKRKLKISALLLTAGLCGLTWIPAYNWDDAAAVMQRGEDGEWVRQESTPLHLGVNWNLTQVQETSGASAEPNPYKGSRHISRIWIQDLSEGFASNLFGRTLQERWMQDPKLDEVAYFPAKDRPLLIRRPPHLFAAYELEVLRDVHLPFYQDVELRLQITVSASPLARPIQSDLATRPGPIFRGSQTYRYRGFNLVSRALRFDRAMETLVPKVLDGVRLDEWRGPEELPDTPLEWAGEIPEVPAELALLQGLGMQPMVQQAPAGLLEEFGWTLERGKDPRATLRSLQQQLEANNWTFESSETTEAGEWNWLDARRGNLVLSVGIPGESEPIQLFAHALRLPDPETQAAWLDERERNEPQNVRALQVLRGQLAELPRGVSGSR
ncbi:MAG: hypothetical protein R3F17_11310 [Planctomycetota bacterium]